MARSRIGPLALEGPLSDPQGGVFRAIHVQQKMQVAVRIMATPVGMTPEGKRSFVEECESLKGLKHPGIVRCFGGGFDAHDAYLVYELCEGESLQQLLERRQRLSWEVVLDYGLQLSQALQVAHEQGWIHGRIRPDKILVNHDGSLAKIADFRRELDQLVMVNGANSIRRIAYQAPEAFRKGYTPQVAGDLYSLGAVMYHALTGKIPFEGESVGQIAKQIQDTPAPAVAVHNFECPVWLSAIVEQLLDKQSSKRPFTAAATYKALQAAHENALSGVGVAQHLVSGFSPLQLQKDRSAAEKALGIKRRKAKKPKNSDSASLTDQVWFLVAGIVAAVGAIVFFTLPLSERTLRKRAEALLAREEIEFHYQARDEYLYPLTARFPKGEHAAWATDQITLVDMEEAERRMERNRRFNRQPSSEGERKYEEAQRFERFGDPATALERYRAITKLMADVETERPFVNLSLKQITRLEGESASTTHVKAFLADKLSEAEQRMKNGDRELARETWRSIVQLYQGNQELAEYVQVAQEKLER